MTIPTTWLVVGFIGQAFFTARFLVQWIASEKARRSVVPLAFWFLSLGGGTMLLAYAISRRDPVFILGQSTGLVIYTRNLWLIHRSRKQDADAEQQGTAVAPTDGRVVEA